MAESLTDLSGYLSFYLRCILLLSFRPWRHSEAKETLEHTSFGPLISNSGGISEKRALKALPVYLIIIVNKK